MDSNRVIFLFDVDGTLTKPRNPIEKEMLDFLTFVRSKVCVGLVSGSDKVKIEEQLTPFSEKRKGLEEWDYVFSENGLMTYQKGVLQKSVGLKDVYSEEELQKIIRWCLQYISKLDLPFMRGTFIEFRNGMINVAPIGRNCTQEERDIFSAYDKEHKIRENMVVELEKEFKDLSIPLQFSIGGQISIDIFPQEWNKTFCLRYIKEKYTSIYFFGDRTEKGGNDHEIYNHPKVIGIRVLNPQDTMEKIRTILNHKAF